MDMGGGFKDLLELVREYRLEESGSAL